MFEYDRRIYYDRRAATALGDLAAGVSVAAIHYELALRYAILPALAAPPIPAPDEVEPARSTPAATIGWLDRHAEIQTRAV